MSTIHLPSLVRRARNGLLLCPLALLTACGGSPETDAMAEGTDLAAATDLFEAPTRAMDANRVLVRIDETEITQADLMSEMNTLMSRMQGRVPPERMAQMQEELTQGAMENLIIKRLLLNQVEKQGIEVPDDEIDTMIGNFRQQMPEGVSLEDQLAQMNMNYADFRENLVREMAVNKLLEQKVSEMEDPSEDEIVAFHELHKDDYFAVPESVQASHILIRSSPEDDPETRGAARAKLEAIRTQVLEGADFAALAAEESDCPSAQQGGDLGKFGRGQMVPPFEEAAFSQALGEIGEIVETDFGFHLIKVDERYEPRTQPLEEARDQITQFLSGQAREKALRDYVDSLREEADIEFMQTQTP